MEGKTGRTKGKENTCRTVGITKALADSGHSTARKGFFYFFALKFGYSIETKNPNASPIRKVFGLFVCGRSDRVRTCGIDVPNVARYQLRHTPMGEIFNFFGQIRKWSNLWSKNFCRTSRKRKHEKMRENKSFCELSAVGS